MHRFEFLDSARWWWDHHRLYRILLQLFEQDFDGFFQRGVAACGYLVRSVDHLDIGRHTDTLHHPRALGVEKAELRCGDAAAIHQRRIAGDADQASPRPRSDDGAQVALAEVIREGVA